MIMPKLSPEVIDCIKEQAEILQNECEDLEDALQYVEDVAYDVAMEMRLGMDYMDSGIYYQEFCEECKRIIKENFHAKG